MGHDGKKISMHSCVYAYVDHQNFFQNTFHLWMNKANMIGLDGKVDVMSSRMSIFNDLEVQWEEWMKKNEWKKEHRAPIWMDVLRELALKDKNEG